MMFKNKKKRDRLLMIIFVLSFVSVVFFTSIISASFLQTLTQSDFDEGIYNQTYYNTTNNAVQVNLSYSSGNYTSKVFDMGSPVTWNNLSWSEERISCPTGMAYINKLNGYCIDKYEASMPSANSTDMGNSTEVANRNAGGTMAAESRVGVVPWVRISQINSRIACENAGKYLCTDAEWLASANVQGEVYNLATNLRVSPYYCVTDSNTYCLNEGYESGEACNTGYYSGGISGCYSSEGVYDMVGNVWEWTNETVGYTKPCNMGSDGWCYWNGTGFQTGTDANTAVYGNDGVYFKANTQTGKAVLRGCPWSPGAVAGPFCAILNSGPTDTRNDIGFRCCSS